jgi:hypothetical protein
MCFMTHLKETLLGLVEARAPQPGLWLQGRLPTLSIESFGPAFASAARRFGHVALDLSRAEQELLRANGDLPAAAIDCLNAGSVSGLVRVVLLMRALELVPQEEQARSVARVFDTGDNFERAAVLRSLNLLSGPERLVDVAVNACRTHVQDVFEALACENPYPASFFSESQINQLVLKCFFTDVPLRRVVGLKDRLNSELARMALGYASERTAAGRSVPVDLEFVTANGATQLV